MAAYSNPRSYLQFSRVPSHPQVACHSSVATVTFWGMGGSEAKKHGEYRTPGRPRLTMGEWGEEGGGGSLGSSA